MPFIQTGDISNADHVIRRYSQTYSEAGVAQSFVWPRGTVCIAIVGATIGETGILDFDACFPDSVIGIRPDPETCDPAFVEFLLQAFKDDLKQAGKGSARDNINLATFQTQKFPIPSLDVQKSIIASIVNTQSASVDLAMRYRTKLSELADLRQSLLQKAFSGQL